VDEQYMLFYDSKIVLLIGRC